MKSLRKVAASGIVLLFVVGLLAPAASAQVLCGGEEATIIGTVGADDLQGTAGPDVIVGYGGNDTIDAGGGDDIICAGPGNDVVRGGSGDDVIQGNAGNDTLYGDNADCFAPAATGAFESCPATAASGDDVLFGGAGADFVSGDRGSDQIHGGPGADTLHSGYWQYAQFAIIDDGTTDRLFGGQGVAADEIIGYGSVVVFAGGGADDIRTRGGIGSKTMVYAGWGDDTFSHNGPDPDFVDLPVVSDVTFYGGPGDDTAYISTAGTTTFFGGDGDDEMPGGEGSSGPLRAFGGAGDDVIGSQLFIEGSAYIDGGPGNDTLGSTASEGVVSGGPGDDFLVYGPTLLGGPGNDELAYFFQTGEGGPGDDVLATRARQGEFAGSAQGNGGNDQIYIEVNFATTLTITGAINGGPGGDTCGSTFPVVGGSFAQCESTSNAYPDVLNRASDVVNNWYD